MNACGSTLEYLLTLKLCDDLSLATTHFFSIRRHDNKIELSYIIVNILDHEKEHS